MKIWIAILIFLILILLSTVLLRTVLITGNVISSTEDFGFDYSWTKAIHEGNNAYRDYEIVCADGEPVRVDPVSGVVLIPLGLEDSRIDEGLCPR
jgi:hypothetical protein